MVTHPSANWGPSCLISVISRELVFPTWYSRRYANNIEILIRHWWKNIFILCEKYKNIKKVLMEKIWTYHLIKNNGEMGWKKSCKDMI